MRNAYWFVFNALARLFGVVAILVGGIFIWWGLSLLLNRGATLDVDGIPSHDLWTKSLPLVAGAVAAMLGIMVLKAKRFRPDLGDAAFSHSDGFRRTPHDTKKT